jgi:hypothetical protein
MILAVLAAVVLSSVAFGGLLPQNGKHYNLNIIGAPKDKNAEFDNPDRHTIMVDRTGHTNIYMTQGTDFAVIDGDGTDGTARFQLGAGRYEVYACVTGKPNKSVVISPEATFDDQLGEEVFYLDTITLSHNKPDGKPGGKPQWERVTGMFLVTVTIWNDDGDGVVEPGETVTYNNEWVFDIPELIDYWWNYDSNGARITKVRFYKVESIPEEGTVTPP